MTIDIKHILSKEQKSVEIIRKEVLRHGCVLVENCDLSPVDMQQLALTFGQLLELPRGFAFDNNTDINIRAVKHIKFLKYGVISTAMRQY